MSYFHVIIKLLSYQKIYSNLFKDIYAFLHANKNNLNLVVVTINDSDDWNTHKSLYEYAFNNYKKIKVLDKKKFKVLKDKYYDKLYIKNNVYLTLKKNEDKYLISHIKLEKKKNYKNGSIVGKNYIYLDNELVHTENIYAKKKKHKWFK